MFSPSFLACCKKSCIYLIEQITVANLNPNWFQMQNCFFQQSRCFAVWFSALSHFVVCPSSVPISSWCFHHSFDISGCDVPADILIINFRAKKVLCNTLNFFWIFFCEPTTSGLHLWFSLCNLFNKHQHMKMCSLYLCSVQCLFIRYTVLPKKQVTF